MNVELTTMVMIQDPQTGQVLVQERTRKWPGLSFPGGKVEHGESFHDCAIREIKEETGLGISGLEPYGVVHWCELETAERYLVFLYKTQAYEGELIREFESGRHFWMDPDALLNSDPAKLSNGRVPYILLYFRQRFGEVFIPYQGDDYEVIYY